MGRLCIVLGLAAFLAAFAGTRADAADEDRYPLFGPEVIRFPTIEGDMPAEALPLEAFFPLIEPAPPAAGNPSPTLEAQVQEIIVSPAQPVPWWKPWEGSFELGMNGTSGNMDTFNLRIGAKAKRTSPLWAHTAEFTHIDKTNNNRTIAYSLLFDGRAERLFPESPWRLYSHGLTEYDEFKAFNVRLSADTGVGYQWLKTDVTRLLTRFGPSVSREFGGLNHRYNPELTTGLEFEHAFNPRSKAAIKSDYFPSVKTISDFRVNSRASWEVVVAPMWGVSLKFSLVDRYDSTPGRAQRNDLDYSLLALWGF